MGLSEILGGPVSAYFEGVLREAVRQQGVVGWLDADKHFAAFAERLEQARAAGALNYPVFRFRGSHLELMLELEDAAKGSEAVPTLLYLPGFNQTSITRTPLYELYAAGKRRWWTLSAIVNEAAAGKVRPDQITTFLDQPHLSLEAADAWLSEHLQHGQAGLGSQLSGMPLSALFDDLLGKGYIAGRIRQAVDADALWQHLSLKLGIPDARARDLQRGDAADVAFRAAAWALCVEYVHDLKRPPSTPELVPATSYARSVVDSCSQLAAHLRNQQPGFYRRTAAETELELAAEVKQAEARDLGRIDTFRFEEDTVLKAAVQALLSGDKDHAAYEHAAAWAKLRLQPKAGAASFWLSEDPTRHSAWQLVEAASQLGLALNQAGAGLGKQVELDAAVRVYAERGAPADRAHRVLEQRRVALLFPPLPEFDSLRSALDALRGRWRQWADAWAVGFNNLCRRDGFLPHGDLQQRNLFNQVVKPLTAEPGTTAFFMVDALRFEMGQQLYEQLQGTPQSQVELRPRLAELPTVTEVGMNVLAPVVSHGQLTPAFSGGGSKLEGFSTGEYRVGDIDSRKRAMHAAVGGNTCPWERLEDIVNLEPAKLKQKVSQARLLVVHSREIDNAGEKGVGPAVFDIVMQRLRAAWRLLRDAGVKRFVFTSDHGFLLVDPSARAAQSHGRAIDPKRRHVFSEVAADHTGEARVALADLGYLGATGHLMFPETTAVFDTGNRGQNFVHGGNSLQERVIPVLTIVHRAAAGGSLLRYRLEGKRKPGVLGMHCIEFSVHVEAQTALDFGASKSVELALRAIGDDDVQVELVQVRSESGGPVEPRGGSLKSPVDVRVELFFRLIGSDDARLPVELYHPGGSAEVTPYLSTERFAVSVSAQTAAVAKAPRADSEAPRAVSEAPSADLQPPRAGSEAPSAGAEAQPPHPQPEGQERRAEAPPGATLEAPPSGDDAEWLAGLPSPEVHAFFAHLARHGTVTEQDAIKLLGGARALRRFSRNFEQLAQRAPFSVSITSIAGVKRYVREGKK